MILNVLANRWFRLVWLLACGVLLARFLLADQVEQQQHGAFGYSFMLLTFPSGLFVSWFWLLISAPPLRASIELAQGAAYWAASVGLAYLHWFRFFPWLLRDRHQSSAHV